MIKAGKRVSWQMHAVGLVVCSLAISACGEDDSTFCGGGLVCPDGQQCAANQPVCIKDNCGNGVVDAEDMEVCDDGNIRSGDGCSEDCRSNEWCGNEIVDMGEACDDGVPSMTCDYDCSAAECGDGIVNDVAGEECEGDTLCCNDNCRIDPATCMNERNPV